MIIDSKLPAFKGYLSEGRLNNNALKTSIDQSAVASSEQNSVDLELKDSTKNSQDSYKEKKKNQSETPEEHKEEKLKRPVETEAEGKSRNMKLLNLL